MTYSIHASEYTSSTNNAANVSAFKVIFNVRETAQNYTQLVQEKLYLEIKLTENVNVKKITKMRTTLN